MSRNEIYDVSAELERSSSKRRSPERVTLSSVVPRLYVLHCLSGLLFSGWGGNVHFNESVN